MKLSHTSSALAFVPNPLPPEDLDWQSLVSELAETQHALSELVGFAKQIPNPGIFLAPLLFMEATSSTRIEGTMVELEEVLQPRHDPEQHTTREVQEVLNYIAATKRAMDLARQQRRLNSSFVGAIHQLIAQGIKNWQGRPGEFRKVQNWIAGPGTRIENARFVPPPPEQISNLMDDLYEFVNRNIETGRIPHLVAASLLHCQFECIHPFGDGNGRVGRILVLAYLSMAGLLTEPIVPISVFLEKNRRDYVDNLLRVSQQGDYETWIRFMLSVILMASNHTERKLQKMKDLREEYLELTRGMGETLLRVVDLFFERVYLEIKTVHEQLGVSYAQARSALEKACELDICRKVKRKGKRGRKNLYFAKEVLDILLYFKQ